MVGTPNSDRMSEALMRGSDPGIPRDDILRLINPPDPHFQGQRCLVGKTPQKDWVLLRGSIENLAGIRQAGLCNPDLTRKLNVAESEGRIKLQPGGPNCSIAVRA